MLHCNQLKVREGRASLFLLLLLLLQAAEVPSLLAEKIAALTEKLTEMNQRIDAGIITSPSTVAIVGDTFFEHPGKSFALAVPSTFSMPKANVIDAWRMWHGGSKRCGENGREKVRPFKNIPEEHLLAISKKEMRKENVETCNEPSL